VKKALPILGLVALSICGMAAWPYTLVVSPKASLQIVDDRDLPLSGIRIVRECDSSEGYRGSEEAVTSSTGEATFQRIETTMSRLKRTFKPLLVLVPAMCGPSWETYGHAEYHIYWPTGLEVRFSDKEWTKYYATYQNRDGIHIGAPHEGWDRGYLVLYTMGKTDDFKFTLKVYPESKKNQPNQSLQPTAPSGRG
jgi:hypothetical protein